MSHNKHFQYGEMILLALDGQMSDEQFSEFDRLLREDTSFRHYYLKFMAVNASLGAIDQFPGVRILDGEDDAVLSDDFWSELAREERTAERIEVEVPKVKPEIIKMGFVEKQPRTINKFSLYTAIISSAALFFAIMYVNLVPVKTASLVGKLSRTVGAQWQDASGHIIQGCDLYAGPMKLLNGYAEIILDGGAVLIVQAPSQFTLESTQQVYLQRGQLVARMKGQNDQAFLVRTPYASVVDYGTEFGVKVDSAGQTEAYVYEGQVQLRDSSNPIKFMKSLSLKAGQGAEADTESNLRSRQVDPKIFVRPQELETRYLAQNGKGYYRWRTSIYRLHRDPSLVAHYFFEKSNDNPQLLINSMFPDREEMRGTFGDAQKGRPTWVQGRWPQKEGMQFERAQKQAIVIPPDEALCFTRPLTICTWLYFPNADQWGGHLIACRNSQSINYQFSLFDKNYDYKYQQNRFEFRQYNEAESRVGFYSDPFVPESGKWYHAVVVYDGSELRIYVNGKLFQSVSYEGMFDPVSAEIVIGAVKKKEEYVLEAGDFDGVVDELMVFNRDLSEREIQAIYEAGKPG